MSKKLIEMVCTGNSGRSPVAELIGRNYVASIGAANEFDVISSGSHVDIFKSGETPQSMQLVWIQKAINRGDVYSASELVQVNQAVKDGNASALSQYYSQACDIFKTEEHQYRAEALRSFGIEGMLKKTEDQTIARPDAVAIWTMASSNRNAVRKIYAPTVYAPIIENLAVYALNNPSVEIPNAFGGTKAEYFATIESIKDMVPKAIDRLLK